MISRKILALSIVASLCSLRGQQTATAPLTLAMAVQRAREFPSIEASREQISAAAAGIREARTNYLPGVHALGQVNRATRNNVFGLLLPQAVVPNISGPVLGTDNGRNVWGSAVGVLVSWEPFDFGRRHALLESAEASRLHAQVTTRRIQFDVQAATAAAFMTLLASEQTARAAQAAVDRAQILVHSVQASVNARLRPGADLSRATTELYAAQTQQLQSAQSMNIAKAALAEYTGINFESLSITSGKLLQRPPEVENVAPVKIANHPAAREQSAVVEESEARLKVIQRSYRPTFQLQLSGYARGTGALTNGATLDGWNGLAPNYFNAAAGITVDFPVLAFASLRAQQAREAAIGRSDSAKYRQVLADLEAQRNAAQATVVQARQIAEVTPKQVADARMGFRQANAQYRSGLTGIVGLAEAQRLLAQAEIDDSLANLAVWRAVLQMEITQGDISAFLAEASESNR